MRRGRLRKLQAGLLLPWTRPPYGFRLDPERPRDPAGVQQDGAEAAVVATLFALHAEGRCSLFGLASKLQRDAVVPPRAGRRWNMATVRQILTNPVYTAQVHAGRIQGLSCSGRCPSPGYRCCQRRGKLAAVHSHRDTICPSRHIPAAQLDALAWDGLCQMLTCPGTIRLALERAHGGHWPPQELQARCETLRRGQAGLQRQVERLTEAYLAGVAGLDECQRRRRDREQRERRPLLGKGASSGRRWAVKSNSRALG